MVRSMINERRSMVRDGDSDVKFTAALVRNVRGRIKSEFTGGSSF